MNNKSLAYALLRIAFGINFAGHGLIRIHNGVAIFAQTTAEHLAKSPLPQSLLYAFSYAIPFLEAILGLALILGVFTRISLICGAVFMMALTIGVTSNQQWELSRATAPLQPSLLSPAVPRRAQCSRHRQLSAPLFDTMNTMAEHEAGRSAHSHRHRLHPQKRGSRRSWQDTRSALTRWTHRSNLHRFQRDPWRPRLRRRRGDGLRHGDVSWRTSHGYRQPQRPHPQRARRAQVRLARP